MQNICEVMQTLYTSKVANSEHMHGLVFVKQKFGRSDRGFRRRHQRLSTTSSKGVHQGVEHQFRRR